MFLAHVAMCQAGDVISHKLNNDPKKISEMVNLSRTGLFNILSNIICEVVTTHVKYEDCDENKIIHSIVQKTSFVGNKQGKLER